MPFQMNFSKESLSGAPPVPDGWYQIMFSGFKQEAASKKDSINLNPQFFIHNHSEYEGRKVWANLNTKGPWVIQDFVHACGVEMEKVDGTDESTLPGIFKGMEENPEDPSKWEYLGPLTNKVFEAEVFTSEFNGRKSNKIKQYKCAVPSCSERHSTNLGG